jgi:nicotinate-nucleotide--dimethylbenzimidazole phosphoribosyltransferase
MTRSPADHLAEASAVQPDASAAAAMASRAAQVVRPAGALDRLDRVAAWYAGWRRSERPTIIRPAVVIFAADHGVAALGVSAYPATVTKAMVAAVEAGQATSSVLAALHGAEVSVVDVGVGEPTGDLTTVDALDPDRFAVSWSAGADAVATVADSPSPPDVVIVGELGIGNTTAASAVAAAVVGGPPEQWCGRGTGVDDDGLERKRQVVGAALRRLGDRVDPLEALRRVGGAELAAIAGATVECRRRSIPMILDGFIATAAVAPLEAAAPGALDHCLAGHASAEPGHRLLLRYLDREPLLELDLRLGEGSGALVALPVLRSAVAAVTEVATFAEAGVAGPES